VVRDDGPGIARDHWARVLDPFVTFEGGRSGARRRLGLGLAIVSASSKRMAGLS